ncbi:MAG: FAD-binding protein [Pseudomonadota bacterium]
MTTLLICDHSNSELNAATAKALTAAIKLGSDVHALVAGHECGPAAEAAAGLTGVAKVLKVEAPHLEHQLAEEMTALVVRLADSYDAIVAAATANGKNIMPRIAARLDVMQVSDVTDIQGPDTFERPIYAGNALQTVQSTDAKKVVTVRTAAFETAEVGVSAEITRVEAPAAVGITAFERADIAESDRPELASAKIIVSGGRGMQSGDNFDKYITPVADKLGAAIGASRAAVDAGYVPNDYQVGQTGKVVAPDLYVAVGISGAIQHLAGMKDSKVIVAINKDGEAPIFQVADYGLVADLFEALPELEQKLDKSAA